MLEQKELLTKFVNKQQKVMYGMPWEPVISKLDIFETQKVAEPDKNWPSQEELEKLPLENKIKLHKIHYKHTHSRYSLTGLKLEFTNGIESPEMQCGHGPHEAWKQTIALDELTIKKVAFKVQNGSGHLDQMKIWDDEDNEVVNVTFYGEGDG